MIKFVMTSLLTNFMTSSLSNISEGIHRIKCRFGHNDENVKHVELNIGLATIFLNTQILKKI